MIDKKTEKKIRKLENEVIRLNRVRQTWKMKYEDKCKKHRELKANNEPNLIERNKRQEQIIIDLQKELQELKPAVSGRKKQDE